MPVSMDVHRDTRGRYDQGLVRLDGSRGDSQATELDTEEEREGKGVREGGSWHLAREEYQKWRGGERRKRGWAIKGKERECMVA